MSADSAEAAAAAAVAAAESASDAAASELDQVNVAENLRLVRNAMQNAAGASAALHRSVRLVAVSKTKPLELLQKAYDEGECRIFGENYAQELIEKVPHMAKDVQWHFIGNLQSNKVNKLVNVFEGDVSRLVVETVDTIKLANKLNNAAATSAGADQKLRIFVQVNTSGEASKSGCEPSEALVLCQDIVQNCGNLELMGLMTIGAPGDVSCFDTLVTCRNTVQAALGDDAPPLELSMGMSGDYVQAIEKGATNVRVGSTIFGARNYANKA